MVSTVHSFGLACERTGSADGTINEIAATGGWQKWKTTNEAEIKLTEGVHELKIEFKGNSINPNYFELTYVD